MIKLLFGIVFLCDIWNIFYSRFSGDFHSLYFSGRSQYCIRTEYCSKNAQCIDHVCVCDEGYYRMESSCRKGMVDPEYFKGGGVERVGMRHKVS